MILSERLVCLLTLVLGGVFFAWTFSFPQLVADPGGTTLVPRIAAVAASVAALAMLIGSLRRGNRAVAEANGTADRENHPRPDGTGASRIAVLGVILCSILYPWLIIKAGFVLATIGYVVILMMFLGAKILHSIAFAALLSGFLYFLFIYMLDAYVPPGEWIGG